ncbi:MAG TPA: cbb3-type cytochrome oxidase assembly protein CcoS [Cyclobacteriaceae bacterium]|nr:cbb3-type cytochrome oxidase assembly protein CcoS [Cyclobacteriaceae bacterium]
MDIIIGLILISLIVALAFLCIFIWAMKSGQFDDTETPSMRILFDNKKISTRKKEEAHKNKSKE